MSKIPINCVLFLKTRAPFLLNKQANISNNRAIAHNVKGERERPSGKVFVTFRVCKKHCSNVQSSRYLIPPSLSQPLNEWSNRSPACCRKSPKCFFPMQTTFTAALNLHKLSHCPAQQVCNNSSVAGKGIWVTGFLWLAQFATKLSLIGSSPLPSRIKTRIDKGKDKEKYQYKDKNKVKDKILK